MKIYEFTVPELDAFRQKCNFTDLERSVFEERARGRCIEEIADDIGYSYDYILHVSQKVNRKIVRSI